MQVFGQVHADGLGAVGRGRYEEAEVGPFIGSEAGLLAELALRAFERVFACLIQLAGGDLGDDRVDRIAVLAFQDDVSVRVHGDDADRLHVRDHFPHGRVAVRQGDAVAENVQDHAVKDLFARDLSFAQALIFFFIVIDLTDVKHEDPFLTPRPFPASSHGPSPGSRPRTSY